MSGINGIHHLAISTGDMKKQLRFFTQVMGMKLKALYWMHGVEGAWHGFLELNERSSIAFVFVPQNAGIEGELGVSHAANGGAPSAGGTMQHISFNVSSPEELVAIRSRIRANGVPVFGPIDHGMCQSIYFAGPEGLNLEVAVSDSALDADAWVDPEVVALAGISAEELPSYLEPEPLNLGAANEPQPAYDPDKPHMHYPPEAYQEMLKVPDDVLFERSSYPEPPVKKAAAAETV